MCSRQQARSVSRIQTQAHTSRRWTGSILTSLTPWARPRVQYVRKWRPTRGCAPCACKRSAMAATDKRRMMFLCVTRGLSRSFSRARAYFPSLPPSLPPSLSLPPPSFSFCVPHSARKLLFVSLSLSKVNFSSLVSSFLSTAIFLAIYSLSTICVHPIPPCPFPFSLSHTHCVSICMPPNPNLYYAIASNGARAYVRTCAHAFGVASGCLWGRI